MGSCIPILVGFFPHPFYTLSLDLIQINTAHAKALSMVVSFMMSSAISGAASDAMHSMGPFSSSLLVSSLLQGFRDGDDQARDITDNTMHCRTVAQHHR